MEPAKRSKWLGRAGVGLGVLLIVIAITNAWGYSGVLRDELVALEADFVPDEVEVVTVGAGRITVTRTASTEANGIWGVVGPEGYGQASVLVGTTADTVERAFRVLQGTFDVGEQVWFDPVAYPGDPREAHGIEFDEVRFTGELGVYPAWVIENDRDIWVVIVHGAGSGYRAQALRIIPAMVASRYSVMVVTVRGDPGAPPSRDGLRSLGATEWRDVAAAIDFGRSQNAKEFVLVGLGTGASTVAEYLHGAEDITDVKGAVFDSALFDPERLADRLAVERSVIPPLRGAGKLLARIRFDIDWDELDQIERADEYTVPVLVLHGAADSVVPIAVAEEFVAAMGDRATLVPFEEGTHNELWNVDPPLYESSLVDFIETVTTAE